MGAALQVHRRDRSTPAADRARKAVAVWNAAITSRRASRLPRGGSDHAWL